MKRTQRGEEMDFLTVGRFADEVGVKHSTVLRWITKGWVDAEDFSTGKGQYKRRRIPSSELARVRKNQKLGIPVGAGKAVTA